MVEPSLQLNFAKTRQLDRRITFARADTADNQASYYDANGILKYVRKGEPRFTHDPATGSSLGLLIEEARTNLLTYSEQFDNAAWTKASLLAFGSGSVANAITAPDGTTTADKIVESTANDEHRVDLTRSVVAGEKYTWSIFLKAEARTNAVISLRGSVWTGGGNAIVRINLATLAVVYYVGNATDHPVVVVSVHDGWVRVAISGTVASNGTGIFRAGTSNGTNYSYTGDGTSGLYIWGAQLEAGAFPTSYIPCVASTVTRVADSAVMTGANFSSWYRQDEGTFVVQARRDYDSSESIFPVLVGVDSGVADNRVVLFTRTIDDAGGLAVVSGGATQANILSAASAVTYGTEYRLAAAIKTNDFVAAFNGTQMGTDTSGTLPSSMVAMRIGASSLYNQGLNGTLSRLTYYPVKLSSAELQALSKL